MAEYRNSAIHLGEIIQDEKKEIFHAFLAATSLLVDELGIQRQEYFGEFAKLVHAHLDDSLAETGKNVAEQLARSKTLYAHRYSALEKDQMEVVVKSMVGNYPVDKYERVLVDCPACGQKGLLTGSYKVEWDIDYDRDGSISGGAGGHDDGVRFWLLVLRPSAGWCGRIAGSGLADDGGHRGPRPEGLLRSTR